MTRHQRQGIALPKSSTYLIYRRAIDTRRLGSSPGVRNNMGFPSHSGLAVALAVRQSYSRLITNAICARNNPARAHVSFQKDGRRHAHFSRMDVRIRAVICTDGQIDSHCPLPANNSQATRQGQCPDQMTEVARGRSRVVQRTSITRQPSRAGGCDWVLPSSALSRV